MREMFRKIAALLTGNILSSIVRAFTLVFLARLVSPSEFAIYTGIFGVLVLLKSASDLGIHKYVLRERASRPASAAVTQALKINNGASLALLAISALGLTAFAYFADWQYIALVLLAAVAALEKNADTWFSVLLADNRVRIVSADRAVRRLIALGILVLLVSLGWTSPLAGIVVGDLVAAAGSYGLSRMKVARELPVLAESRRREVLNESFPFWINGLAMNTKWLDVAIVGLVASPIQSGYFAVGSRISGPLRMIPSTMAPILISHASRTEEVSKRSLVMITAVVTGGFVLLSLVLIPLIPWIIRAFLGAEYVGSAVPMQIIVMALPIQVLGGLVSAVLQGAGLSRVVSRASLVYVVAYLSSLAVGALLGGASGAAWSTLLSQSLFAVLLLGPGLTWFRANR